MEGMNVDIQRNSRIHPKLPYTTNLEHFFFKSKLSPIRHRRKKMNAEIVFVNSAIWSHLNYAFPAAGKEKEFVKKMSSKKYHTKRDMEIFCDFMDERVTDDEVKRRYLNYVFAVDGFRGRNFKNYVHNLKYSIKNFDDWEDPTIGPYNSVERIHAIATRKLYDTHHDAFLQPEVVKIAIQNAFDIFQSNDSLINELSNTYKQHLHHYFDDVKNDIETKYVKMQETGNDDRSLTFANEIVFINPDMLFFLRSAARKEEFMKTIYFKNKHTKREMEIFCNVMNEKVTDDKRRRDLNYVFAVDGFRGRNLKNYMDNLKYSKRNFGNWEVIIGPYNLLERYHVIAVRNLYETYQKVRPEIVKIAIQNAFDGNRSNYCSIRKLSITYKDSIPCFEDVKKYIETKYAKIQANENDYYSFAEVNQKTSSISTQTSIPENRISVSTQTLVPEKNDPLLCGICLREEKQIFFENCGHVFCCASCSDKLEYCPICRKCIGIRVRLYFA